MFDVLNFFCYVFLKYSVFVKMSLVVLLIELGGSIFLIRLFVCFLVYEFILEVILIVFIIRGNINVM